MRVRERAGKALRADVAGGRATERGRWMTALSVSRVTEEGAAERMETEVGSDGGAPTGRLSTSAAVPSASEAVRPGFSWSRRLAESPPSPAATHTHRQ